MLPLFLACAGSSQDQAAQVLEDTALPPPTDDCTEALDNDLGQAQAILGADGTRHTGLWICEGDIDVYAIAVPPMSWLAFEVQIGGSGHNPTDKTDLDLWELDDPQSPLDDALRTTDEEDIVWYSASAQPYERLAWYNDSQEPALHYIAVDGYHKAVAAYDISVTADEIIADCSVIDHPLGEAIAEALAYALPRAGLVDEAFDLTIDVPNWSGTAERFRIDAHRNTYAESYRRWSEAEFASDTFDFETAEDDLWGYMTLPLDEVKMVDGRLTIEVRPDSVTMLRIRKP